MQTKNHKDRWKISRGAQFGPLGDWIGNIGGSKGIGETGMRPG